MLRLAGARLQRAVTTVTLITSDAQKSQEMELPSCCRLITYWPARSIFISGAGPEFRRNSRRASPVNRAGACDV